MTDVSGIAPKFTKWQIVNGIYGWTNYGQNGVWTPGITFKGGTAFRQAEIAIRTFL